MTKQQQRGLALGLLLLIIGGLLYIIEQNPDLVAVTKRPTSGATATPGR